MSFIDAIEGYEAEIYRYEKAHRQLQVTLERFRAALEKIARSNTAYGDIAAAALTNQQSTPPADKDGAAS